MRQLRKRGVATLVCTAMLWNLAGTPALALGSSGSEQESPKGEDEGVQTLQQTQDLTYVSSDWGTLDGDELFQAYANRELWEGTEAGMVATYSGQHAGEQLTGMTRTFYDLLKPEIEKIAAGERTDTVIAIPLDALGADGTYTAQDLGVSKLVDENNQITQEAVDAMAELVAFDANALSDALRMDCPLELYWFDKTVGMSYTRYPEISGRIYPTNPSASYLKFTSDMQFRFTVSTDYSVNGGANTYVTDVNKTSLVQQVRENAQSVVNTYAGASDWEKLRGYAETICNLVDYNYDAASNDDAPYGNPWQLMWVFDGDKSTKVVCEGYAKAFQYLCELTKFQGEIICYSVTGNMNGQPHMWNLVEMDDGESYLVDVTNCDYDVFNDHLFFKGCTDATPNGFVCDGISYVYDEESTGWFTQEQLTMSGTDYMPVAPEVVASGTCGKQGDNLMWTLDVEGVLEISGKGDMADYSNSEYLGKMRAPWYEYREQVAQVQIGVQVTSIGTYAFYFQQKLKDIRIPAAVTSIGTGAFTSTGIETICVEEGNVHYKSQDGALFSKDGTQLLVYPEGNTATRYEVPDGVSRIAASGFGYTRLQEIILPSSVEEIGEYAFAHSWNLARLTLAEGVRSLGDSAFDGCHNLKQLYIPATVESIGSDAFWLSGLAEIQVAPSSTNYSSQDGVLFSGDGSKLVCYPPNRDEEEYEVPEGVSVIGERAIMNCDNLVEVVLPEGLISIQKRGLAFNNSLKVVSIPKSLKSMDNSAFNSCDALQAILYAGSLEEWNAISGVDQLENTTVHYDGIGHVKVVDKAVPATCATTGLTEGGHCSVCGMVLQEQKETGVRIYLENTSISDTTLDGDVYIGPNAVVNFTNVTIEGNLYVLGGARLNSIRVNEIHARSISLGYGSTFYHGTVYWRGTCSIGSMIAETYPIKEIPLHLEEGSLLAHHGTVKLRGATPAIADFYVNGTQVNLEENGWFTLENLDVTRQREITFTWKTVFGNTITKSVTVDTCAADGHVVVVDAGVKATCIKSGLTEGQHCRFCDEVLKAQEVIPATGHHFVDDVCTVCGAGRGVQITGKVRAYGNELAHAEVRLISMGEDPVEYTAVVEQGAYVLEEVPEGEYVLEVRVDGYATREYSITVGLEGIIQDVSVCLMGDINGDGNVTVTDLNRLFTHINGDNPITDAYALVCGDTVPNGNVSVADLNRLYVHVSGSDPLWEKET